MKVIRVGVSAARLQAVYTCQISDFYTGTNEKNSIQSVLYPINQLLKHLIILDLVLSDFRAMLVGSAPRNSSFPAPLCNIDIKLIIFKT